MKIDMLLKQNDTLYLNDKKIEFDYVIRDFVVFKETIIVLLSIPDDALFYNNVFGVSEGLEIIWQIQDVKEVDKQSMQLTYQNIFIRSGEICVTDFYGRGVYINDYDGRIINRVVIQW